MSKATEKFLLADIIGISEPSGGILVLTMAIIAMLFLAPTADCYPPYQAFVEKHSGRTVNCALCHVNDNGPMGDGPGQLGNLNKEEQVRLQEERAAMLPGKDVNSPILNEFGNHIIKQLGRAKFLQTMSDPAQLATALGNESDLDNDGIPDSQEYLDGTDPLNKFHGDPWRLFKVNLLRYKAQIFLGALSIGFIWYGLNRIYRGFQALGEAEKRK